MSETEPDLDIRPILSDPILLRAELSGSNPESPDLPPDVIEQAADDKTLSAMLVALRRSDPGVFMQLAADLRSPEGALKAARALIDAFDRVGLDIKTQPKP